MAAFVIYNTDLIIGGAFTKVGGIPSNNVGGWNGSSWFAMPGILGFPIIGVLHKSNGFLYAGGLNGSSLHQWDGANWTIIGPALDTSGFESISVIETFNNELIIGGNFRTNNLQPSYIAKWNGVGWDSLGTAIKSQVDHLIIYNGELIAAGQFSKLLGSSEDLIASWNGSVWSSLDNGIRSTLDTGNTGLKAHVDAMVIYNNELIVAGRFNNVSGTAVNNIAKWNGSSWQAIGSGFNAAVATLSVYNNELIAAGTFTASGDSTNLSPLNYIAKWDGSKLESNWKSIRFLGFGTW